MNIKVSKCAWNSPFNYLGNHKTSRENVLDINCVFNFSLNFVRNIFLCDKYGDACRNACRFLHKIVVKHIQLNLNSSHNLEVTKKDLKETIRSYPMFKYAMRRACKGLPCILNFGIISNCVVNFMMQNFTLH
jgi:hypothetical protein